MNSITAKQSSVSTTQSAGDDLQRRRMRTARRRVLVLGAWVVFLGLGLAFLITWRRDVLRINHTTAMARDFANALAEFVGPGAPWPTTFPPPGVSRSVPGSADMTYLGPHSTIRAADGKQVLAYSSEVLTSFTHRSGRAAVVIDGHRLSVAWLTETQLKTQTASQRP